MASSDKQVERFWGKIPVVDAKKELRVFILPDDVRNACPKDADSCVFALACKRACGASRVLFFRTIAYVELPDKSGKMRVERFMISDDMKELISRFDRGLPVQENAGFTLLVPKPSKTLDNIRKVSANNQRKRAEGVLVSRKLCGTRRNADPMQYLVRSGTGKVQFVNESKGKA
jgi:hypothetical protein